MLAYIKGEVTEIGEGRAVVENQGLGYELLVPLSELEHLSVGKRVKVYTHMQLLEREGTFQIYGFLKRDTLELFRLLIGVSGVGPKAALGILSGLTAEVLRFAVLSDDAATIAKAPGIGKKTAQKLILELKDKLDLQEAFESKLARREESALGVGENQALNEAVEALTALGYSGTDALRAVRQVEGGDSLDVESLLKAALKQM